MISHEHKFIFIHIPKCAGTTIERAFGHLDTHRGRGGEDHRTLRMLAPIHICSSLSSAQNRMEVARRLAHLVRRNPNPKNKRTVTKRQFREYFKFAIVRNPWTRAASVYMNVMRGKPHRDRLGITADLSLGEFLATQKGRRMLRPQIDWIVDWTGRVGVDFVGRFERLDDDFAKICSEIGVSAMTLPAQGNKPKQSQPVWDDKAIQEVQSFYHREIEYFGYTPPL